MLSFAYLMIKKETFPLLSIEFLIDIVKVEIFSKKLEKFKIFSEGNLL